VGGGIGGAQETVLWFEAALVKLVRGIEKTHRLTLEERIWGKSDVDERPKASGGTGEGSQKTLREQPAASIGTPGNQT